MRPTLTVAMNYSACTVLCTSSYVHNITRLKDNYSISGGELTTVGIQGIDIYYLKGETKYVPEVVVAL